MMRRWRLVQPQRLGVRGGALVVGEHLPLPRVARGGAAPAGHGGAAVRRHSDEGHVDAIDDGSGLAEPGGCLFG